MLASVRFRENLMTFRFVLLLACAALGGCATSSFVREPETPGLRADADNRYEPVAGRDASVIDPLRAGAPPEQTPVLPGRTPAADQELLTPQAFVLIGNSRHRRDDDDARRWIAEQARAIGADTVRWYVVPDTGGLAAAYFVRVRLVFGATFRDLNATERTSFPAGGVRLGEIVGDSPASRANLRAGDIVTALDASPVKDRVEFQSLLREHMGRTVELNLARGSETLRRKVQLGRTFAATP
ncbi:MAG TPA: PDZ domain-containing protein [Tahibacter sp.]|uniref:PDZ domain-containing protein n=1 Tax=Tahibacter sp. TaxID=2056211 RepID=UPI002D0FE418|nr:PDZ domain-containing protein [Tahibacter sp.]HSX62764.1 PDZ domain-containing protein [Tahibacter sp.]